MSARRLSICQVIDSINDRKGGTSQSVTALAEYLAAHDVTSHIFSINYPEFGPELPAPHSTLHSGPAGMLSRALGGITFSAKRRLDIVCRSGEIDLLHNHGHWLYLNYCAACAARAHSLPLVISCRGMLEPWSLAEGHVKKHVAWTLYERRNIAQAALLHATSSAELHSIRTLGITKPVAVIPNGVILPDLSLALPEDPYPKLCGKEVTAKRLLFLSRLHKKKGLDMLLAAWAELRSKHSDWQLVIAGPDEGYGAVLHQLLAQHRLDQSVHVVGPLAGANKDAAFRHAQLFVLPSYSENFGNVIAEALSYEVPAIATTATPWRPLVDEHCGWWVPPRQKDITRALDEAMSKSGPELHEMGTRGRHLVAERFGWDRIAEQMLAAYHWVKNAGVLPESIDLA